MLIFGCDPGESGGICAINHDGTVLMYWPMRKYCDAIEETILEKKTKKVLWVVEKAQAMPKNGCVSMFNYGTWYGKVLGGLEANAILYQSVRPSVWTKAMFTGSIAVLEKKQRNVKALRMLAPDLAAAITPRTRPHMGICDAYLIAEYARRYMIG